MFELIELNHRKIIGGNSHESLMNWILKEGYLVRHLENLVILREGQSRYFNFLWRLVG